VLPPIDLREPLGVLVRGVETLPLAVSICSIAFDCIAFHCNKLRSGVRRLGLTRLGVGTFSVTLILRLDLLAVRVGRDGSFVIGTFLMVLNFIIGTRSSPLRGNFLTSQ